VIQISKSALDLAEKHEADFEIITPVGKLQAMLSR